MLELDIHTGFGLQGWDLVGGWVRVWARFRRLSGLWAFQKSRAGAGWVVGACVGRLNSAFVQGSLSVLRHRFAARFIPMHAHIAHAERPSPVLPPCQADPGGPGAGLLRGMASSPPACFDLR